MILNDGLVGIYTLTNTAAAGDMPTMSLAKQSEAYFQNRVIGYGRLYAAKGVNESIDLLIRLWYDPSIRVGQCAVISDSDFNGQYHIDMVQHTTNEDGLKVTDLTLTRLEETYAITE